MRKKHLAFFLAFILGCSLLAFPAAADGAVLRVTPPDSYPKVGESFEVTVELEGNPGISIFQVILNCDADVMRCTGIEAGALLANALYDVNLEHHQGASLAAISDDPVTGDGTIAVYSFVAVQEIKSWDCIVVAKTQVGDVDGKNIPYDVYVEQAPPKAAETQSSGDAAENTGNDPDTAETPQPDTKPEYGTSSDPSRVPTGGTQSSADNAQDSENVPQDRNGDGRPSGDGGASEGTANGVPEESEEDTVYLFDDTTGHWGEAYISDAVRMGLFQGYSKDRFGPDDPVTRGQFVTVLYRLAGKPQTGEAVTFEDISDQLPEFQAAIAWAAGQGYVNGRSTAEFDPNGRITRQEAMKILFAYSGGVSGMEAMLTSIYDAEYTDSAEIAAWAKSAIYWGVYNRLISGTGEMTLSPQGTATRAQLAKILVSYVNL